MLLLGWTLVTIKTTCPAAKAGRSGIPCRSSEPKMCCAGTHARSLQPIKLATFICPPFEKGGAGEGSVVTCAGRRGVVDSVVGTQIVIGIIPPCLAGVLYQAPRSRRRVLRKVSTLSASTINNFARLPRLHRGFTWQRSLPLPGINWASKAWMRTSARPGQFFRKWFDSYFLVKYPRKTIDPGIYKEMFMLIVALDELYHGRTLELGDILTSKLRHCMVLIKEGKTAVDVADEMLTFNTEEDDLIPSAVYRAAVKAAEKKKKDHAALAALRGRASR